MVKRRAAAQSGEQAKKSRGIDVATMSAAIVELGGSRGQLLREKLDEYEEFLKKVAEAKADLKFAAKELRRTHAFLTKK